MESENSEYFNMPVLLRYSTLNVRKLATSGLPVTVEEYFNMLTEFLQLAPRVRIAIDKFASLDGEEDDYKSLRSMIVLLEDMECEEFVTEFHSLLDAYGKKGNWRGAAAYARKTAEDFNSLCLHIEAARTSVKPDALSDITLPLNELIRRFDEEEAHRQKLNILAVDDSPIILKSVSSVLSSKYKVFTLPKPTKLEKVLQKLTPELFLLDYKMPEISGFELVAVIRSFEEHKDTPIIFLTSEGTIDTVTAAFALGACDFIVKPFKPDILHKKIAKHIVKKKLF